MLRMSAFVGAVCSANLLLASPALAEPGADALNGAIQAAKDCQIIAYDGYKATLRNLVKNTKDSAQQAVYQGMLQNVPALDVYKCLHRPAAKKKDRVIPQGAKLKIADDDVGPRPQDRVYFNYNYFYVAGAAGGASRRLGSERRLEDPDPNGAAARWAGLHAHAGAVFRGQAAGRRTG